MIKLIDKKLYQDVVEELKGIALNHKSRAEWSCLDPNSYDYALFNLDDEDYPYVMKHMYDANGTTFSGDVHDPRLGVLTRNVKVLENRYGNALNQEVQARIINLKIQIAALTAIRDMAAELDTKLNGPKIGYY